MIVQTGVLLRDMCSYKIGGRADLVFFPENFLEMRDIVRWHKNRQLPFWVAGRGCNTIFSDAGTRISVIGTHRLNGFCFSGTKLTAQAGAVLDKCVLAAISKGLGGFEGLSGIPGSIGGALHMNAGAFDTEISQHLVGVTVLSPQGEIVEKSAKECDFSYRSCGNLQNDIFLEGKWELVCGDGEILRQSRKEILQKRNASQPLNLPSAGSVFKRPKGDYASRLIDAAGLKGKRIGGMQVSDKHAGFIVNVGDGSSRDLFALIDFCQKTVQERLGVTLELEQQICPCEEKKN